VGTNTAPAGFAGFQNNGAATPPIAQPNSKVSLVLKMNNNGVNPTNVQLMLSYNTSGAGNVTWNYNVNVDWSG